MGGCSSGSLAMLDTAKTLYGRSSTAEPQGSFNPQFTYLRTVLNGTVNYLVLGYVDQRPEGAVEVWYSSTGQVVKLLNGHLVGTGGLPVDWRDVRLSSFNAFDANGFTRERDLMPGYRFGVRDTVTRVAIEPPASSKLAGVAPASLRWYEERASTLPADAALPPARFGMSQASGTPVVIYSEQCLSRDYCMSFERWTPAPPTPVATGK